MANCGLVAKASESESQSVLSPGSGLPRLTLPFSAVSLEPYILVYIAILPALERAQTKTLLLSVTSAELI